MIIGSEYFVDACGVTDTEAWNNALAAAADGGGVVVASPGKTYTVADGLELSRTGDYSVFIDLRGAILNTEDGVTLDGKSATFSTPWGIRNGSISASRPGAAGITVLGRSAFFSIRDLTVVDSDIGILMRTGNRTAGGWVEHSDVTNVNMQRCGRGVRFEVGTVYNPSDSFSGIALRTVSMNDCGIGVDVGDGCQMARVVFSGVHAWISGAFEAADRIGLKIGDDVMCRGWVCHMTFESQVGPAVGLSIGSGLLEQDVADFDFNWYGNGFTSRMEYQSEFQFRRGGKHYCSADGSVSWGREVEDAAALEFSCDYGIQADGSAGNFAGLAFGDGASAPDVAIFRNRQHAGTPQTYLKVTTGFESVDGYVVDLPDGNRIRLFMDDDRKLWMERLSALHSGGVATGSSAPSLIAGYPATGATADRPSSPSAGQSYFDTTLGQPIWWDDTDWVDATGTAV